MTFRVNGARQTKREIDAAIARARDLNPVLTVAAADTKTLIDDAFDGSHSPDGTRWQALSPKTIAKRRQGSSKPLIDTAILRNSVTATARGVVLSFGTNVIYARPHQMGFERTGQYKRTRYNPRREAGSPWRYSVPARPFLPVTPQFALMTTGPAGQHWREVREMVREYIRSGRTT